MGSRKQATQPELMRSRCASRWLRPPLFGLTNAIRGKRRRRKREPHDLRRMRLSMSRARVRETTPEQDGGIRRTTGRADLRVSRKSTPPGGGPANGIANSSDNSTGGQCGFSHAQITRWVHCGPWHVLPSVTSRRQASQTRKPVRSSHHWGMHWRPCRCAAVMWFFRATSVPNPRVDRV